MAAIHRDDLSEPAVEFQQALAGASPVTGQAAAVRARILDWDGRIAPDSAAAAAYSRVRWALARIVADASGLAVAGTGALRLPGQQSAASQLWWVLPALLRSDDRALTGGASWPDLLAEALAAVAAEPAPAAPWRELHRAALTHPLSLIRPDAPAGLSPPGAAVGGDNETVWANGCRAESGTAATYGAVARYVMDVGNWDACQWIVLAGSSGDSASPHYLDQHDSWARCELIPMRYGWDAIASDGPALTLLPDPASPGS
jgi:penicillin amidase